MGTRAGVGLATVQLAPDAIMGSSQATPSFFIGISSDNSDWELKRGKERERGFVQNILAHANVFPLDTYPKQSDLPILP